VRYALIHEALANIPTNRPFRRRPTSEFCFLVRSFQGVFEQIVSKACCQKPLPGQCQGYARSISRNPPSPQFLGDVRGRAASTSRIKDKIAWISRHQNASFQDLWRGLYNITFVRRRTTNVRPHIAQRIGREVINETYISECCGLRDYTTCS
jgi:hypothetical protein